MKKLATILLALIMILSTCTIASAESVTLGKYALVTDGSYEYAVNSTTDINIYFYDLNMGANTQYMAFNLADFAGAGIDTPVALADFFLDTMLNSDTPLLADMVREYNTYGDIECVEFYGNIVVSEGGGCYAGIILADEESLLTFLSIPTNSSIDTTTARASATSFLNTITLNGTYVVDMGDALTESYGSFGSIGDSISVPTIGATGDAAYLGTHVVYPPIEWTLVSSTDTQLSFMCGDTMIIMGVYQFGDSSTMTTARSLGIDVLAELLTSSTYTGLEGTGVDVSSFTLTTVYYDEDDPVITFTGDASAVMSDSSYSWLTGATLLTDTDMAMIMIFSDGSDPVTIDGHLWDAVAMLIG